MNKKINTIILLTLATSIVLYVTFLDDYLSLERISTYRNLFFNYTQLHPYLSRLFYISFYFLTVVVFLPSGAVLNLLGGFLFGTFEGFIFAHSAACAGAILNLLFVRSFLGAKVQEKYKTRLQHFNESFNQNGTHYLLSIRLLSIFPFAIVNTFAALTQVSLWNYLWTTSLGIIPGQTVFIYMGKQLGNITTLNQILTWPVMAACISLALLVLLPTAFQATKNIHQST